MTETAPLLGAEVRPADADRVRGELHRELLLDADAGPAGAWSIDLSREGDLDATPLRWSDEVYRIFGYEPGEVEVSTAMLLRHVHPEDRQRLVDTALEAIAHRLPFSVEHRIVGRDGAERVVLERGEARFDAQGRPLALHGTVQHATPHVRALEALRLSEDRARRQLAEIEAIYATAPIGLCVFDRQLRWVRLNRTIAEMNGVPLEAHLGRTPREIVPDVGEQAEAALRRILETGEPLEFEMNGTTPAQPGVRRSWSERWSPIRRPDGEIIGISVATEEITERKRAEERMASLARFPEENPNPVLRVSRDLRVLYANAAARASPIGATPGREAPPQVAEAVRRAPREGGRGRTEVTLGASTFCVTVVPVGGEVSLYAQDVTALRSAEEALREANAHKDEFIATLSHELRNPLAPIRNSAYVLEHADPASEEAHRARAVVQRQAEHLSCLVDDLLDVTRIASGKLELRRARIDLREVVRRVGDDFRLTLQDRGVVLRTAWPDASVWVDADATRLAQVLVNLLQNAAKFTRRGDEVMLSLHALAGRVELRVRDTGLGIEPEVLPHVFDRFTQGRRTRAVSEGGLGLGLALVKGITELHGGTVRVESAGRERGAEFIVELPVAPVPAAQAGRAAAIRRGAAGRRVLVVDDDRDGAESLADLIRVLGHEVEVAHDGPSAIEKAQAREPDVVVCDIGLPGMSGYDVAKALRARRGCTRLVALSGYAQPEDVRRAIEAGFDAHVAKPPSVEEIERFLA